MASFTKGKWQWGGNSIFANVYVGKSLIASLVGEGDERQERDANARLIAAAPEMYEWINALLHDISKNDECDIHGDIRELAAIIERIDGKEDNNG